MIYEEIQYAKLLGAKFDRWKIVHSHPFLANFRCPFCGDSQRDKNKARGYFYTRADHLHYYCHNCPVSGSFEHILKDLAPDLYREYLTEVFANKDSVKDVLQAQQFTVNTSILDNLVWRDGLKRLSKLLPSHPARAYFHGRGLPEKFLSHFYYAEHYPEWRHKNFSEDNGSIRFDPRIVIPLLSPDGVLMGATARAIGESKKRYIMSVHEGCSKIWINPFADTTKRLYVFEGVFDATFIDQSAAMLGTTGAPPLSPDVVYVLDSDRRNPQVAKRLNKYIQRGEKVVIWDNPESAGKDVNEMMKSGFLTPETIASYLESHTFQGLQARLNFGVWNKSMAPVARRRYHG